jgi:sarcosine oxidase, subunit alpha
MNGNAYQGGANRLPGKGRLTPAKTVRFSFDGRMLTGLEGDTLASALIANGIHLMGRSFKYHRPRGVLSAGAEEPNALMQVSRDSARYQPNVRASVQEIFDGLRASSQNRYPSLAFDVGAINDALSPLFSAGFYYKTFMWPRAAWNKLYEPVIRHAAGLGESPKEADPDHYAQRYAHCDVLVVGGGLAGLSAALAAAESGASVIICDEQPQMGGALHFDTSIAVNGETGFDWAQKTAARLAFMDNVRVLTRTTAFGYYAQNFVGLAERVTDHLALPSPDQPRERLWQVRAKRVVLATGAIERHMVFPGNDRPGIMLASAARIFLNHYGVAIGAKVAVYTACDSAYEAAFDLQDAGVRIPVIVEAARHRGSDPPCHCLYQRQVARFIDRGRPGRRIRQGARHRSGRADYVGRLDAIGASFLAVSRQGVLGCGKRPVPAGRQCAGLRVDRRLRRDRRSRGARRTGCRGRS